MLQVKSEIARHCQEWKNAFYVCFALNLLAYLGYLAHITYAVDDYGHFWSGANHLAHGRWFADFIYNVLLGKSFMPTLSPVIAMACYILSGIGLCALWKVAKNARVPIIALWSLHPYLLDVYNFRIAAVNCAVVYLITVTALLLVSKGKGAMLVSVILFYLALSTYQVVFGFAAAAIMMQVLLLCVREGFSRDAMEQSKKLVLSYAIMLVCAVVLYAVLTKVLFVLFDVDVNPRVQAGFLTEFDQLKAKLCVVGTILFVRLGPIKEFVLPFAGKLALFIIYLLGVFTAFGKTPRWSVRAAALLWIALIPLGAVCFMLPLETLDMPWRISLGLAVFAAGMFALTQESDSAILRRASFAVGVFLVAYFILNNNTLFYRQYLTNQKDLVTGIRIIAKIQSLEGYRPGMDLAIVGSIKKEDFSREGKGTLEIVREFTKFCSVRRYSLAVSAFEADWSKYSFLLKYMDLELKQCSPQAMEKASAFSLGRKPWPDPSSVFIQDGIVVVILSKPDDLPFSPEALTGSGEKGKKYNGTRASSPR
ncbi:MAG: glucosyltransferase domain-containing protein [Planctomycetales bacterium]|nr:glucosyltransferase domain-containing protein [Planctomycetales bacterium]